MSFILQSADDAPLFYVGYAPHGGPIKLTTKREEAYEFPSEDFANNCRQGDERLKGFKVKPA